MRLVARLYLGGVIFEEEMKFDLCVCYSIKDNDTLELYCVYAGTHGEKSGMLDLYY